MDQMDSVGLPLHKEHFACAQPQWTNDGLILADSALDFTDLLRHPRPHEFRDWDKCVPISIGMSMDEAGRQIIHATLNEYGGNKRDTAKVLGISLKTLYNRLAEYQNSTESSAFGSHAVAVNRSATGVSMPAHSQNPLGNLIERRNG